MRPNRVIVVGSGGAGKSTFAARLAAATGAHHVEVDTLAFAGREHVPFALLHERLAAAVSADRWVLEGMHRHEIRTFALPLAEMVVWLDIPKWLVCLRLGRRALGLLLSGSERHGRRLTLGDLPEELAWARKTLRKYEQRRGYAEALVRDATQAGISTVHLRSTSAVEAWLRTLEADRAPR